MNSNVNIGFTDNRSSSRILKPPGGDTSDIFGTRALKEEENRLKALKIEEVLKSELEDCKLEAAEKACNEEAKTEEKDKGEELTEKPEEEQSKETEESKESEEVKEKVDEALEAAGEAKAEVKEEVKEEKKEEKVEEKVEKPKKKRIPPGGYSSGLW